MTMNEKYIIENEVHIKLGDHFTLISLLKVVSPGSNQGPNLRKSKKMKKIVKTEAENVHIFLKTF